MGLLERRTAVRDGGPRPKALEKGAESRRGEVYNAGRTGSMGKRGVLAAALAALASFIAGAAGAEAEEKRVVFVAGAQSHGYGAHEHNAGALLLSGLLNDYYEGVTSVVYQNGWPEEPDAFEGADSIVIYADGGGGHPALPHLEELGAMMDDGVGLVVIHWATGIPPDEAGDEWLAWVGGNKEPHWAVNPHWVLDDAELGDHPINRGVEPYTIDDEWYYHLRFREDMEGVDPILSAHPPHDTLDRPDGTYSNNPHVREAVLERGEIQHVAWASERDGGGRGFGFTGAHWHWNWGHPMFRRQVLNAIAWTAHAEVPEGGAPVGDVTIEDLQANQDYDMPDNFDLEHWENLVNEWREAYNE